MAKTIDEELHDAFKGQFMQPYIHRGTWFAVDTTQGMEVVPCDVIGRTVATHVEALANYLEGEPLDPEECAQVHEGFIARLSAPGYMDCTEWAGFDTAEEAARYLIDTYGEDFPDDESEA